jgi:hypothetical protein
MGPDSRRGDHFPISLELPVVVGVTSTRHENSSTAANGSSCEPAEVACDRRSSRSLDRENLSRSEF